MSNDQVVAIVRIRGVRKINPKIKKTLELLRLNKPNQCVLVKVTDKTLGMIKVVKDYVGYGNVTGTTIEKLLKKRGEKGGKLLREVSKDEEIKSAAEKIVSGEPVVKYLDPVFRLHPPRKGFKNIKKAYPKGDLGKRDDMDQLIKRMM